MKTIQLKKIIGINFILIIMSLTLTACGGGSGGSSGDNTANQNGSNQPTQTSQPTATPMSMLAADEDSESMEISNIDTTLMADSDAEDDANMSALLLNIAGTSSP